MRISDEWLKADRNNLTLVRLILASAVIISHSYWFVYGVEGEDSFSVFLGRPISGFAVDGFFFLSGFLVYGSLIRRHDIWDFLRARLARLWPALFVSVSLTAIGGLWFTSAPSWSDYFQGATGSFLLRNLLLQGGAYTLTGVSCGEGGCPVNGSLWTIAWEVRCYVLLALLLPLGLAGEKVMARVVLPLTFVGALLWHVVPIPDRKRAVFSTLSIWSTGYGRCLPLALRPIYFGNAFPCPGGEDWRCSSRCWLRTGSGLICISIRSSSAMSFCAVGS